MSEPRTLREAAQQFLDHVAEAAGWPTPGIGCDADCKQANALRSALRGAGDTPAPPLTLTVQDVEDALADCDFTGDRADTWPEPKSLHAHLMKALRGNTPAQLQNDPANVTPKEPGYTDASRGNTPAQEPLLRERAEAAIAEPPCVCTWPKDSMRHGSEAFPGHHHYEPAEHFTIPVDPQTVLALLDRAALSGVPVEPRPPETDHE